MKHIVTNNFFIPKYNMHGQRIRKIRSFVCRRKKLNVHKIHLIKKYWPIIGLDFEYKKNYLSHYFINKNLPIVVDIGFGCGESILYTSYFQYNYNILGIEVYVPGIVSLLNKLYISSLGMNNIKIIAHDAVEVFKYMLHNNSISIVQSFFPDPWPKLRHHKRRIFQLSFIKTIAEKLISGGILHIITDCESYYISILDNIKLVNFFRNISNYFNTINFNIGTKFEKKVYFKKKIFHLIFECIK